MKISVLHIVLLLLVLAVLLLWLPGLGAAPPAPLAVPARGGHVVDVSGVLAPEQRTVLEQRLNAFEQQHGSQLAVLLVPTTQPEQIEQFALRVAEQWKLGRSKVDDGAVVVVATGDQAARIEVGYGLEGVLTDAASKRIIDELMLPHFRRGDYFAGIDAGVLQMQALVAGEVLPAPSDQAQPLAALAGWLPAFLLAALFIGRMLRSVFGRLAGATIAGSLAGLSAWLLTGTLLLAAGFALGVFILVMLGIVWFGNPGALLGGHHGANGMRGGGGRFGGGGSSGRW